MRLFIIPEPHSSKHLTGCSNVNMLADYAKALHAASKGTVWSWMAVPTDAAVDELEELEGDGLACYRVGSRAEWQPKLAEPGVPHAVIEAIRAGSIDFVINRKFLHTPMLAYHLLPSPSRWYPSLTKPVVTWWSETQADRAKPLLQTTEAAVLTMAMLQSGRTVVTSQFDKTFTTDWVRKQPGGALVLANIIANLAVVPAPVATESLAKRRRFYEGLRHSRRRENGELVLLHAGTLQAKMHHKDAIAAVEKCFAMGRKVRMEVLTQNDVKPVAEGRLTLTPNLDRRGWLKAADRGDLFYCGSDYEATGLALVEAVATGMLPIVRPMPWIESRIPKSYPLVAKTPDQLAMALAMATENFDGLRDRWLPEWDKTLEANDATIAAVRSWSTWQSWESELRAVRRATMVRLQPVYDLAQQVLADPAFYKPTSLVTDPDVLRVFVMQRSREKADFKHVPKVMWRELLLMHGYRDTTIDDRFVLDKTSEGE